MASVLTFAFWEGIMIYRAFDPMCRTRQDARPGACRSESEGKNMLRHSFLSD